MNYSKTIFKVRHFARLQDAFEFLPPLNDSINFGKMSVGSLSYVTAKDNDLCEMYTVSLMKGDREGHAAESEDMYANAQASWAGFSSYCELRDGRCNIVLSERRLVIIYSLFQ